MQTKAIQILGTGSGVGKSIVVTALCRIFWQDGYKVCPFKAQNMALNSFVTSSGGEIGRAQATQARASYIEPTIEINPILIKPTSDLQAQVILRGRPIGKMAAATYVGYKRELIKTVRASYNRLKRKYDVIVIEGAGSPAEINLKRHDIANMKMAEYASAPAILVGDIDKGGVFAWLWGTFDLLTKKEKNRIKGIIINKFRGDKNLLDGGLKFLERKTGKKILGVIPYFKDINIAQEDSVSLQNPQLTVNGTALASGGQKLTPNILNIAVCRLPYISNFTDFDPLTQEINVSVRYVAYPEELSGADVIIIPGTKNVIDDFIWLEKSGLAQKIQSKVNSAMVIGICGGFQMLGKKISDPLGIESNKKEIKGLGLLDMVTILGKRKMTCQVKARELTSGIRLQAYEIHHGRTQIGDKLNPVFEIFQRAHKKIYLKDGARNYDGSVWGTYLHGVFDNDSFRTYFLNQQRKRKKIPLCFKNSIFNQNKEIDKLAQLLRKNIDMEYLYKILHRRI
jgi:adenosylcobyric acid synthase